MKVRDRHKWVVFSLYEQRGRTLPLCIPVTLSVPHSNRMDHTKNVPVPIVVLHGIVLNVSSTLTHVSFDSQVYPILPNFSSESVSSYTVLFYLQSLPIDFGFYSLPFSFSTFSLLVSFSTRTWPTSVTVCKWKSRQRTLCPCRTVRKVLIKFPSESSVTGVPKVSGITVIRILFN